MVLAELEVGGDTGFSGFVSAPSGYDWGAGAQFTLACLDHDPGSRVAPGRCGGRIRGRDGRVHRADFRVRGEADGLFCSRNRGCVRAGVAPSISPGDGLPRFGRAHSGLPGPSRQSTGRLHHQRPALDDLARAGARTHLECGSIHFGAGGRLCDLLLFSCPLASAGPAFSPAVAPAFSAG